MKISLDDLKNGIYVLVPNKWNVDSDEPLVDQIRIKNREDLWNAIQILCETYFESLYAEGKK